MKIQRKFQSRSKLPRSLDVGRPAKTTIVAVNEEVWIRTAGQELAKPREVPTLRRATLSVRPTKA